MPSATESNSEQGVKKGPFPWSDTILLALISGGAYYTARSYECGYLAYYGVGCEVATINSDVILRFATILIAVAFATFQSVQFIWSQDFAPFFAKWRWLPVTISACLLFPLLYWWPGLRIATAQLVIAALVLVVIYAIPLLPIKRHGQTYGERLDHILSVALPDSNAGFSRISKRFGPAPIVIALIAALVIPVVGKSMGAGRAYKQTSYKVYRGNWLLVGIYGDRAILVQIDTTPTVTGRILLKSTNSEDFELETRTVGHVEPAPVEAAGD